jgi:hypothetical protein
VAEETALKVILTMMGSVDRKFRLDDLMPPDFQSTGTSSS